MMAGLRFMGMKTQWIAILTMMAFCVRVFAEDPTPSPTPRDKYGYQKKSAASKRKVSNDDDSTPSPTPHSKKKTTKKVVHDDDEDTPTPSPTPEATPPVDVSQTKSNSAPNASLTSDQLVEFSKQPESVQKLIESALALTQENLTYTYGSADPANGGMDCSGFIYYVLRQNGFKDVPRDASGQYVWVRKAKTFQAVLSTHKDSFELDDLRPGDLLFWTGTYDVQRDPPITHTMIYLGIEKSTHKPVMVGSTDGRSYQGKSRWGVSVFDFKANTPVVTSDPQKKSRAQFVGYGTVPGLRD